MDRSPPLHVAVAVIYDAQGRVLVARRPARVHQGGLWEFPGGKLELGEDVEAALRRELWEELHILPTLSRPLIQVPFQYSDRNVFLDVWRVDAFDGVPCGREGQPIQWVEPERLIELSFPAANLPIVTAARLPEIYLITGDCAPGGQAMFLGRLKSVLEAGIKLVQLRVHALDPQDRLELATQAVELAHAHGGQLLVNGTVEEALMAGADGVHLSAKAVRDGVRRPARRGFLLAASCHSAGELDAALSAGADFAVLSPVRQTRSHPGAEVLGWAGFADLVRAFPIPVYALGGISAADLPEARRARAQGIAGISAFWG